MPDDPGGDDTGGADVGGIGGPGDANPPDDPEATAPEGSPFPTEARDFFSGVLDSAAHSAFRAESVVHDPGKIAARPEKPSPLRAVGQVVGGAWSVGIGFGLAAVGGMFSVVVSGAAIEGGAEAAGTGAAGLKTALTTGSGTKGATEGAAAGTKIHRHHLFPQKFRDFFQGKGIDIDQHTVALPERDHLSGVHGRGNEGMPGGWNARWQQFINEKPNAEPNEIFQFMNNLKSEFGIANLPVAPYR
jgi:hypothetical protein